ncbi:hypothetical protein [Aureliella helgolandensis]|uniref:Uncharacterized protein n=1 Tax=Aureliella helgolandensis TaxID=2527968 RepID=A0A518GE96_9BACT|nr:hypothetical protein [Aureliella helgolandensis]QDV26924.1 hypothetical protein Q31a_53040 [Aureliella helgolandensis]
MTSLIVGGSALAFGFLLLVGVAVIAMRAFVTRSKAAGVNPFDGLDAREIEAMRRIFQEMRQAEIEVGLRNKLLQAAGPTGDVAATAQPARPAAAAVAAVKPTA